METEQQEEDAAAAMHNSLAAPASLSVLERMPAEIILMIGSEVGSSDFMVATLVSKRLRTVLLPRLFKNLTFSGSLKKLAHDMRSVTIRFESYSRKEESTDSHLLKHRMTVIGEFISKLSPIDVIFFHNRIKNEIDFTGALGNASKWNGPKAVIFCGRRNLSMFKALINQFAPYTVTAVQLPYYTANNLILALKSACSSLKGLKADVTLFKGHSRTLACMSSSHLQAINRDFPHLEALILDQVDVFVLRRRNGHIPRKPHLPNLNDYVEKLIIQLKSMPRLRRFAFTLQRYMLYAEYDCEPLYRRSSGPNGDESGHPMQTAPEPNEWPYWLPTHAEKEFWWSELITRILEAVPQLKELCIRHSSREYHRGTNTEGIVTVRRVEMAYGEKPSQFPYVLADID
ncbi:hypothetical protein FDENT_10996 [Fusarium denticulatum]|uniref:F-box domain-containing protein n=1 Tax=Fusarium denticulatum TaxID=48507 RepID=A0A8H5TKF4_9HYPO|nr:hypothetical protein FDENT_10996 [Fusarium denticulatum]